MPDERQENVSTQNKRIGETFKKSPLKSSLGETFGPVTVVCNCLGQSARQVQGLTDEI